MGPRAVNDNNKSGCGRGSPGLDYCPTLNGTVLPLKEQVYSLGPGFATATGSLGSGCS